MYCLKFPGSPSGRGGGIALKSGIAVLVFTAMVSICFPLSGRAAVGKAEKAAPQVVAGVVTDVGSEWQTVALPYVYNVMVVVATPVYTDDEAPAVVRIRNASGNSFEVRVQNPSGEDLSDYTVQYLAVEAGVYTLQADGIQMEAGLHEVATTDYAGSWQGESIGFQNFYLQPVVLGQVMTHNDARWSVFWSHGITSSTPPGAGVLYVGKHVGEDEDQERETETVGYIAIEAGTGDWGEYDYQAIAGSDKVEGMDDDPPFSYDHDLDEDGWAVASQVAMDGVNGGWAVLWGKQPLDKNEVHVVIDEDQINDSERRHSTEQVHVLVLTINQDPPELLSFSPDAGIAGDVVTLFGNGFSFAFEVRFDDDATEFTVVNDQMIEAIVPEGAKTGPITVRTPGGEVEADSDFTIVKAPQIFSFDPEEGPRGTEVEITGQNFMEVVDVSFGGWSAQTYEVISDTRIIATVPPTSSTGRIRVRNLAGMATTAEAFTVLSTAAVENIIPDRAEAYATITLIGSGFLDAQSVEFAGDAEAEFTILSDEEIEVTVPQNSLTGPVLVRFDDGSVLQGPVDFILTFSNPFQGINLCRLTSARLSQSSLGAPFARAGTACDGITEGTYDGASITNTEPENGAWWEADLGAVYNIAEVAVWNRVDCCQDQLDDFYIIISDTPVPISVDDAINAPGVSATLVGDVELFESVDANRTGRYVRIQKQGNGALWLSEVEIISGAGNTSTGVDSASGGLEDVVLDRAYPSPFQRRTTITYHLAEAQRVALRVYDALGREVRVLDAGVRAAGVHRVNFLAEDLPNGVYFYRLVSEAGTRAHPVVLAR